MTHPLASPVAKEQPSLTIASQPQRTSSATLDSGSQEAGSQNVHSLAAIWARKYVVSVNSHESIQQLRASINLGQVTSKEGRAQTSQKLLKHLTLASAQAWSTTETLLSEEIHRHGIDANLINPWQIAADGHHLFQKSLNAYAERVTPRRLSVVVGSDFGRVRRK